MNKLLKEVAIVLAVIGAITTLQLSSKVFTQFFPYIQNPPPPSSLALPLIGVAVAATVEAVLFFVLTYSSSMPRPLGIILTSIFMVIAPTAVALYVFFPVKP
ncbi:MAG TPA: hypothetical protein V6D14_33515 [Coleofasciculaceae cyanobacterium]|jgi:hypothetical protein